MVFLRKKKTTKIQWFKEKIDVEILDFISRKNNFAQIKKQLQNKIESAEISVPEAINNFTKMLKKLPISD